MRDRGAEGGGEADAARPAARGERPARTEQVRDPQEGEGWRPLAAGGRRRGSRSEKASAPGQYRNLLDAIDSRMVFDSRYLRISKTTDYIRQK